MKNKSRLQCIPFIAAFLLVLCPSGFAGESPEMLTLKQGISIALEKNLLLQMAREEVFASKARKDEAFAGGALVSGYKASTFGHEATGFDEQTRILDVVKQVKLAYYDILKAKHIAEVARQSSEQLEAHLKNARWGLLGAYDYST